MRIIYIFGTMKTFQSRMNSEFSDQVDARKYLEELPMYQWIKIENIPSLIKVMVIIYIDEGFHSTMKLILSETSDRFMKIFKIDEYNKQMFS